MKYFHLRALAQRICVDVPPVLEFIVVSLNKNQFTRCLRPCQLKNHKKNVVFVKISPNSCLFDIFSHFKKIFNISKEQ